MAIDERNPVDLQIALIIDNISSAYIKKSNTHGHGLFASEDIVGGAILGELDGQVMDWDQYDQIVEHLKITFDAQAPHLFMEWNALSQTTLLVRPFRTKYSFINHARHPNLKIEGDPLRVVAMRQIAQDEELLLDYREEPLRKSYLQGHGRTYL